MSGEYKRLAAIARDLPDEKVVLLLEFAEFLAAKAATETAALPSPEPIPRPASETVIHAIKRLTASYPGLEKNRLFSETSALMTAHVMQGRQASDVIDELEQVFERALAERRSGR